MARLVGNNINSLVQVVDSNGDKVTDAVVNYKVYFYDYDDDEVWEVAQSGLMTHIGDGLYQAEWIPTSSGEYTFYAYSSNPKFHESYTYFIESKTFWRTEQSGGATIDNEDETDVISFNTGGDRLHRHTIVELDMSDILDVGEPVTIRVYKEHDGSSRLASKTIYPNDYGSDVELVTVDMGILKTDTPEPLQHRITIQFVTPHVGGPPYHDVKMRCYVQEKDSGDD
jgi:hypothetical protein